MTRRNFISVVFFLFTAFVISSCTSSKTVITENADGTLFWNGWTLTRAQPPPRYREYDLYSDINVVPNVITTKELSFKLVIDTRQRDSAQFGSDVPIEVLLDGHWYTLPNEIHGSHDPLTLPEMGSKDRTRTPLIYKTSLTGSEALPTGAYRFAEQVTDTEGIVSNWYARFWVKKPGSSDPVEAATQGKARLKDIIMSVDSSYPAQLAVTAEDDMFTVELENLSSKTYKPIFADEEDDGLILEKLTSGKWEQVPYSTANTHSWLSGWCLSQIEVFLFDPLPEGVELPSASLSEGRYRVRFPMKTDAGGLIEPSCEFDVLLPEDAPPPEWDKDELRLSEYEGREPSKGVVMTPVNPKVSGDDVVFEAEVSVSRPYTYGSDYTLEANIGGTWYIIPFGDAQAFGLVAYGIPADGKKRTFPFDITTSFGKIPSGRYRIVREFSDDTTGEDEYAYAEFIYEQ